MIVIAVTTVVVVRIAGGMRDAVPVRMLRAAREDRRTDHFLRVKALLVEVAVNSAAHPVLTVAMDHAEISAGAMIVVMSEAHASMGRQLQSED